MESIKNKIVQIHWIGRFGNRMFQYAFGCAYAKKYNCIYYRPSEWEGDILFNPVPYAKIITDDLLRLKINQTLPVFDNKEARRNALYEYNNRTGDNVEYVYCGHQSTIGKINFAYDDLDCMYFKHCFDLLSDDLLKEIFQFKNDILESDVYKYFINMKETYDVIHLRRGDIANENFTGAHSVISKKSYTDFINKINLTNLIWISDDKIERTPNKYNLLAEGCRWSYPRGEIQKPIIYFDWFPDFLSIMFARTIIRGNSSFSWWASQLSNAIVYSPVIPTKPKEKKNKYYMTDVTFVKGNYPHFMGSIEEGFQNIILDNCTQK